MATYLIKAWIEACNNGEDYLFEVEQEEECLQDYVDSKLRVAAARIYGVPEEDVSAFDYGWETIQLDDIDNLE